MTTTITDQQYDYLCHVVADAKTDDDYISPNMYADAILRALDLKVEPTPTWVITETVQYRVTAPTKDLAQDLLRMHAPGPDHEAIEFVGVEARHVEKEEN